MRAAAVILSMMLLACDSSKSVEAPDVGRVRATWAQPDACGMSDLAVVVEGEPGVELHFLDRTERFDGDRLEFTIPGADLDGQPITTVARGPGGGQVEFDIDLPPRPAGRVEVAALGEGSAADQDTGLRFRLTIDTPGSSLPQEGFGYIDAAGDGVALLDGCGATSVAVDGVNANTEADGRFVARFPRVTSRSKDDADLALTVTDSTGTKRSLGVTTYFDAMNAIRELPGTVDEPALFVPVFDPQTMEPLVVLIGDATRVVGGDRIHAITHVGSVSATYAKVGRCGPYKERQRESGAVIDRRRTDVEVVLAEARTGREVGRRSFKGAVPKCPAAVLSNISTVDGDIDEQAILEWAHATAKR